MKLPESWVEQLSQGNLQVELVRLVRTANAVLSVILIALTVYLPYQAIKTLVSWF